MLTSVAGAVNCVVWFGVAYAYRRIGRGRMQFLRANNYKIIES
jgi:hypothetical protein